MCSAFLQMLHEDGGTEKSERVKTHIFVAIFPELTQTETQLMYYAADCCSQTDSACHVQLHNTVHLLYKYCRNCTVYNWTVLTVITQKLPLHVQLHNSTAHLLYKYCTTCTVYNWTVLTVITQKLLLLHVQLHNSTVHLLYKYCTNCTVYNWTLLTVNTQKLLLHVELHNSTIHLLYKYCTNCTVCNWTVLTVITEKLLLHVQLHNNARPVSLCPLLCSAVGWFKLYVHHYVYVQSSQ